uniref:Uncharacterized protein n=1 Tax=Panagrolaimus davidi TaxID=227884 RepID=A0A914PAN6_9BILA
MIQSDVTPSLLSPQSQILPDISLSFDPFADATAKSLLHNSASAGYLPELHPSVGGGDTVIKANSSDNVQKKRNLACVIPFPPTNNNDPWTSTPTSTTNFDFFKKDTVTQTLSSNGCTSNEAYQKMENDFHHFNFMATTSQNYQSTTELSSQLSPSTTNAFSNGVISINGKQYSPTNPFVKDLLFK